MFLFDALYACRYMKCSIFIENTNSKELLQVHCGKGLDELGLNLLKKMGRKYLDCRVTQIKATEYGYVSIYIENPNKLKEEIESIIDEII